MSRLGWDRHKEMELLGYPPISLHLSLCKIPYQECLREGVSVMAERPGHGWAWLTAPGSLWKRDCVSESDFGMGRIRGRLQGPWSQI
jgi:hypothetical protein